MSNINPVTESELQEKTTGKRVTLDALKENILSVHTFTALQGMLGADDHVKGLNHLQSNQVVQALGLLTICVIVLKNGYTVMGESACADSANYNKDIGDRLARESAEKKIWPLMGYALKEEVFLTQGENGTFKGRVRQEELELSQKIAKLEAFVNGSEQFNNLPELERTNLSNQLHTMKEYQGILQARIAGF